MFQSEYGDIDCKPVNTKFVQGQSLYGAYQKYRITKELQAGLDYKKDAVSVASWCVENPSIYCGMVVERQGKGKFERVNGLYRQVDHIYDVVVVLPLKKNETVVLNVTLPLGIEGHVPVAEYLSASKRPDIVLTRDIISELVHRGKRSCAYQFDLRLSLRHGFSRNPEGFKSSVCMSDGNLYAERLTPRCTRDFV